MSLPGSTSRYQMSYSSNEEIEIEDSDDSEHSYVYCTYPPVKLSEADHKDMVIAELNRKIKRLQGERDEYKRQADLYSKMIAEEKKNKKKGTDKRWTSMKNKSDWLFDTQ